MQPTEIDDILVERGIVKQTSFHDSYSTPARFLMPEEKKERLYRRSRYNYSDEEMPGRRVYGNLALGRFLRHLHPMQSFKSFASLINGWEVGICWDQNRRV